MVKTFNRGLKIVHNMLWGQNTSFKKIRQN